MAEIIYRLKALYEFYQAAHRLASGEMFYQDHLFFGKLYEGFDEEIDTLTELLLVTEGDKDFYPDVILKESVKYLPKFGDSKKNMKNALVAEHELVNLLGEIANGDKKPDSQGIINYILTLSQEHSRRASLLIRFVE